MLRSTNKRKNTIDYNNEKVDRLIKGISRSTNKRKNSINYNKEKFDRL
jgi:hypothetical protein